MWVDLNEKGFYCGESHLVSHVFLSRERQKLPVEASKGPSWENSGKTNLLCLKKEKEKKSKRYKVSKKTKRTRKEF